MVVLLARHAVGYTAMMMCNCGVPIHLRVEDGHWRLTHGGGEAVRDFSFDDMWAYNDGSGPCVPACASTGDEHHHFHASPPVLEWLQEVHEYEAEMSPLVIA